MVSAIRTSSNIYTILFCTIVSPEVTAVSCADFKLWCELLSHVKVKSLCNIIGNSLVKDVQITDRSVFFCEDCQYSKQHKLPFSKNERRKTLPGEVVYIDLCGPMSDESVSGAQYYMLFKDCALALLTVKFLQHKSDSLDCFKK